VDTSHCPSRQEIEKGFRTDATFADKARLADHALVCPACRTRLNWLAGLAVEMKGVAGSRRAEGRTGPAGHRAFLRRLVGPALAPAVAGLMAGILIVGALWIKTPPGAGLSFRGGGTAALELIAPSGTLREPPRVFCWSPYPGVDTYGFELVDDNLETLVPYTYISFTTAMIVPEGVGKNLRPGRTYIWRLWALDENSHPLASEQKSFEIRPRGQSPDKINPAQ
jgi:hypothetical protein